MKNFTIFEWLLLGVAIIALILIGIPMLLRDLNYVLDYWRAL